MKHVLGVSLILLVVVQQSGAAEQSQIDTTVLGQATRSSQIAGYALSKVQRWLHEKALPVIDPNTGLYPADGHWDYRDTAADCYPFLCWAAFVVDLDALNGPVRNVLHAEQKLCNHLDRIPVPYDWRNRKKLVPEYDEMVFQASEYVKDGLVAIVEVTGKDEWFDRMVAIEEDLWKHARIDTPFGKIPSLNVEVNGDDLQSLPRLYAMTGREEFVTWAERLADYYFAKPDFVPERLRDHGCEIIGGLGLLLAVEKQNHRPKAREYEPKLKSMYDGILAKGCNEDGLMYNHLTKRDGGNGKLSDGWGYNYVGYLCYDMVIGWPVYRDPVARTLGNLVKPAYDNYNWEGNYSIDGFADSIEGAIYLLNRVPVEEGFRWVDRETTRSVTRSNEPLETAPLWGTMKLEANGVRTVLMHALMHTQGLIARPWQKGLQLGAVRTNDGLVIVMKSDRPWSGKLCFDKPRHREYMGFAQDWPRMNTLPEWFTVEAMQEYTIDGLESGSGRTYTGKQLSNGIPMALDAGAMEYLIVRSDPLSLSEKIRTMERIHNLQLLDEELSCYTDDGRFELVGYWTQEGRDNLRTVFQIDHMLNDRITFTEIAVQGETAICKVEEESDWFRALGIPKMRYDRCEVRYKYGRIQDLKANLSVQSMAQEKQAVDAFSMWADQNRREEVARLLGGKPFEVTPDNALGWLKLMQEWQKIPKGAQKED